VKENRNEHSILFEPVMCKYVDVENRKDAEKTYEETRMWWSSPWEAMPKFHAANQNKVVCIRMVKPAAFTHLLLHSCGVEAGKVKSKVLHGMSQSPQGHNKKK